jgi:hypothetical protein
MPLSSPQILHGLLFRLNPDLRSFVKIGNHVAGSFAVSKPRSKLGMIRRVSGDGLQWRSNVYSAAAFGYTPHTAPLPSCLIPAPSLNSLSWMQRSVEVLELWHWSNGWKQRKRWKREKCERGKIVKFHSPYRRPFSFFFFFLDLLGYFFAWTQFKKHGSLSKSIDSENTTSMQNSPAARQYRIRSYSVGKPRKVCCIILHWISHFDTYIVMRRMILNDTVCVGRMLC